MQKPGPPWRTKPTTLSNERGGINEKIPGLALHWPMTVKWNCNQYWICDALFWDGGSRAVWKGRKQPQNEYVVLCRCSGTVNPNLSAQIRTNDSTTYLGSVLHVSELIKNYQKGYDTYSPSFRRRNAVHSYVPPTPIPQRLPADRDRSERSSKNRASRLVAHRLRIVACKYFKLCLPEILREKTGSGTGTTSQAPILMSGVGVWRALVREKAGMVVFG
ncbi:hypothetical protein B0H13DRAFT_1916900 [Mycena leptocephala]|nr:hypothetical protein B0H13DRAFT_1916900 [Mycena leptocephala]